jgi:hypothetical protein
MVCLVWCTMIKSNGNSSLPVTFIWGSFFQVPQLVDYSTTLVAVVVANRRLHVLHFIAIINLKTLYLRSIIFYGRCYKTILHLLKQPS